MKSSLFVASAASWTHAEEYGALSRRSIMRALSKEKNNRASQQHSEVNMRQEDYVMKKTETFTQRREN